MAQRRPAGDAAQGRNAKRRKQHQQDQKAGNKKAGSQRRQLAALLGWLGHDKKESQRGSPQQDNTINGGNEQAEDGSGHVDDAKDDKRFLEAGCLKPADENDATTSFPGNADATAATNLPQSVIDQQERLWRALKRRSGQRTDADSEMPPVATRHGASGTLHDFFGGKDHSPPGFLDLNETSMQAGFVREKPTHVDSSNPHFRWHGREVLVTRGNGKHDDGSQAISDAKPCSADSAAASTCASKPRAPLLRKLPGTFTEEPALCLSEFETIMVRMRRPARPLQVCTNVPLLKSHLQKAFRRRQSDLVVRSAIELLYISPNGPSELLRRLPIILIEDSILDVNLPTVVWMMAAVSKGTELTPGMVYWLLCWLHGVCERKARDELADAEASDHTFDVSSCSKSLRDSVHQNLIYSLELRRSFGGMKGDMRMLSEACNIYTRLFARIESGERLRPVDARRKAAVFQRRKVPPLDASKFQRLELDQWVRAAIDFHCSDIDARLLRAHPELEQNQVNVRQLIWHSSSKVNVRKDVVTQTTSGPTAEQQQIWNTVSATFERLAGNILAHQTSKNHA